MSDGEGILITGAAGFLGAHIVNRARAAGLNVVPACHRASNPSSISLDVSDRQSVELVLQKVRPAVVIHCAAYGVNYADQNLDAAIAINISGSLSLLTAAARHGVRRFVHLGSCFEYGSRTGEIHEDAPLNPSAIYGASKAAATVMLKERAQGLGVGLVVLRPFGMWGLGEATYRLVPQVISACLSRVALKLTPCEVIRDLSYVEDMAANILRLAMNADVSPGSIINVATGRGVLLRDFVLCVARELEGEDLMHFGALSYRPTEMPSLVADVTRMRQFIGEPPRTSIAEGVRRMVEAAAERRIVSGSSGR